MISLVLVLQQSIRNAFSIAFCARRKLPSATKETKTLSENWKNKLGRPQVFRFSSKMVFFSPDWFKLPTRTGQTRAGKVLFQVNRLTSRYIEVTHCDCRVFFLFFLFLLKRIEGHMLFSQRNNKTKRMSLISKKFFNERLRNPFLIVEKLKCAYDTFTTKNLRLDELVRRIKVQLRKYLASFQLVFGILLFV